MAWFENLVLLVLDKMLASSSLHAWSLKEDCVLSLGCLKRKLIKCDDFASCCKNSCTGWLSYTESTELQFWNIKDSQVVGDGTHDNSSFAITTGGLHLTAQSSQ